jgi:hypothetical protein
MATIGNIELPLEGVKILRNDDAGIIDLLADLRIPSLMQTIDDLVHRIKGPGVLVIYSTLGAYVLFLYKPPPSWMKEGNDFMAVVSPDIDSIINLMKSWFQSSPDELSRNVINQILNLLYSRKAKDEKKHEHIEP